MDALTMHTDTPALENAAALSEEYGDEVMFSGWNPQVAAAVKQSFLEIDRRVAIFAGLSNADIESFLQNLYEYQ